MRIVLLSLSLIVTAPAVAQIWDGGRSVESRADARPIDPDAFAQARETARIDRAIRTGVRRGELTRREARDLRARAVVIARSSGGPAAAIGPQQQTLIAGLAGLVDAKRAQGRAAKVDRRP